MNRFVYYVEYINNSVPSRRVRKPRLTRTAIVSVWLCGIAILYFWSRLP